MAESKEELKSLLMKVKQGEWKSWLKTQHSKSKDHGIWSHHFSRIDGETMETVRYFIFLGSKITADSDCSHKIKRHLLLEERADELKGLLMRGKEESEKPCLKLNIQKTKTMASGPITSWQIDRETIETVTDFIFLGSRITADSDCSHEIKRRLLLGKKSYDKPR